MYLCTKLQYLPKMCCKNQHSKKPDQIWMVLKQALIMRCIVLFQDIWQEEGGAKCPSYLYSLYGIYFKHHQICALFSKEKHERNVKMYICMCLFRKNITQIQKQPKFFFKKFAKNKKIRSFLKVPLSLTLQSTNINIIIFLKINEKTKCNIFLQSDFTYFVNHLQNIKCH